MEEKNVKCVHVRDIMSLYFDSNKIKGFRRNIMFSSIEHEYDLILEPYSEIERTNMATIGGLPIRYFYLNLPIIHGLGS